jgi:hypothetical protein
VADPRLSGALGAGLAVKAASAGPLLDLSQKLSHLQRKYVLSLQGVGLSVPASWSCAGWIAGLGSVGLTFTYLPQVGTSERSRLSRVSPERWTTPWEGTSARGTLFLSTSCLARSHSVLLYCPTITPTCSRC